MKEEFLHYLWRYRFINDTILKTTDNKIIEIIDVGSKNLNSGPDFFNAKIKIDGQLWAGNVEIHVNSSDWFLHGHETDKNYDNVILHVVWEHDIPVFRRDNTEIATLCLVNYISEDLLYNYFKLFSKKEKWINCENDISNVDKFLLNNWFARLYFERLEQKASYIFELLKESNNDWEAVLFKLLAKNFGLKVNGDSFFSIANAIGFRSFRREFDELVKLEALLYGQAGLLINKKENIYHFKLKKEYDFLSKKYNLNKPEKCLVNFFRLRPSNFPTIRLAQFANLYHTSQNLFTKLVEAKSIKCFYEIFNVKASIFWDDHYNFDTKSRKRSKKLSKSFIDLLLINTIIPLKFVYQKHLGKVDEEEIIGLVESLKPERNSIIEKFNSLGIKANSAFITQALIQLKANYCNKKECLKCRVGNSILKI